MSALHGLLEGYLIACGWVREAREDGSVGWWPKKRPKAQTRRGASYSLMAAAQAQLQREFAQEELARRQAAGLGEERS